MLKQRRETNSSFPDIKRPDSGETIVQLLGAGAGKLLPMGQIHNYLFCKWRFIGTQAYPFIYLLPMAVFTL